MKCACSFPWRVHFWPKWWTMWLFRGGWCSQVELSTRSVQLLRPCGGFCHEVSTSIFQNERYRYIQVIKSMADDWGRKKMGRVSNIYCLDFSFPLFWLTKKPHVRKAAASLHVLVEKRINLQLVFGVEEKLNVLFKKKTVTLLQLRITLERKSWEIKEIELRKGASRATCYVDWNTTEKKTFVGVPNSYHSSERDGGEKFLEFPVRERAKLLAKRMNHIWRLRRVRHCVVLVYTIQQHAIHASTDSRQSRKPQICCGSVALWSGDRWRLKLAT